MKAAQTNKERYGENYYAKMGQIGGKKGAGAFYANPELARRAGKIGGRKSRRGYKLIKTADGHEYYQKNS